MGALGEQSINDEVEKNVLDFIADRLRVVLRESLRHDVVEAVLAEQSHNPYRALLYGRQLEAWMGREDWPLLLDQYARCVRITRSQDTRYKIRPAAWTEGAEKTLYAAFQKAEKALKDGGDMDAFLTAFEPMIPAIQLFFAPEAEGGVLVMDPDQAVRENRLALLQAVAALAEGTADFSLLEGF
jgi:glycyl-tRNA synthetase